MGRLYVQNLSGEKIFKCKYCRVDSASHDDIISKDFQGIFGRAYLFKNVVNISLGPSEDRHPLSGLHTVNDIYCSSCQQILGWSYEKAYEECEKYKEGLYILEKGRMLKKGGDLRMKLLSSLKTTLQVVLFVQVVFCDTTFILNTEVVYINKP